MNYQNLANEIIQAIGGTKNIRILTHCATRLRFEFYNESIIDDAKIKSLAGVISVVKSGGQFQIVIGNEVQKLYSIIQSLIPQNNPTPTTEKELPKKGIFTEFISVISTSFTPVIPAITGAGMIKALLAVLKLAGLISESSSHYKLLNTIADAAFFFLPVLLAFGASMKFKCNPILAMTVAGAMLHPNIASMAQANEIISIFSFEFSLADYSGTVLPILLTVWLMSYIERFADKYSPSIIKFFIKPMIILLVTTPLALGIIGPFGNYLNFLVGSGAGVINEHVSWLIPMLMGGLQPFLIITGTAWAMTPIATSQLNSQGYEMINGPGMLASNIAQGAATLAVAFKTKNSQLKQLASSAGFTAMMGITEPSLYGVTLKLKRPLIAAMIGGGIAGIYAGLSGLVRYAFVSPGLAAIPAFIGENPMNIVHALITIAIATVGTFILTLILGFDDEPDDTTTNQGLSSNQQNSSGINSDKHTSNNEEASKTNDISIKSPVKGQRIELKQVNDEVFSANLIGHGVAVIPSEGKLYAPIEGTIEVLLPSKHAIGIRNKEGFELLMHIGIETVNLNGEHFIVHKNIGDDVKVGDLLIEFDIAAIKSAGYDITTPIVIVNHTGRITIQEENNPKFLTPGEELFNLNLLDNRH
ncbi:beta-glucoside-specific PTS transporter subunit IIABC [Thorsellia anophelis]|uniref:PTS system, beta-glucosides-specific IIC component n=1 Tax=Thorsellia anophelis DSM 18579 TaxID=1123402 RepID=A0A1I0ETP3_9GAMM|nr:beta-glucoside-specific PTS transporter subunit IIABC [Thorsellia anophelis]SET48202.1 PTS system beta-glucoside-specific IIA component, Glc family (TC 4.A.1.2.5)/PTS system beta-glucoside-specific IIB component, Glc family (TC 4.A.1.2.5)/PTS system beta-glucoside-specific IIC component, Glc family (TC 4.A.1.2.5) [Thorsellia anophelis DSM 18579]